MRKVLIKSVSSIASTLIAISVAFLIWRQPVVFGEYPLVLRAILLNVMVLASLGALYPFCPISLRAWRKYQGFLFLFCCTPAFVFYLLVLPSRTLDGLSLEQQDSTLLSDRSSNGIIEIGFQYPIFTPAISIINRGAYSREVNIFLRIIDRNQETVLFRAVRSKSNEKNLTVESTVRGMLSNNFRYLFNPVKLAPHQEVSGRAVFIITNVEDGVTFTEALGDGHTGVFELRDPEGGQLLAGFPMAPI